jgi:ABC-type uncharacterized transport system involved in gliding motility auxiliary subunit
MKKFAQTLGNIFSGKKVKYGTNAAIITAAFIAILIVINLIVGSFPLKADLTKNKIFTFQEQTLDVLKNLKQPVNVYALFPQGNEQPMVKEILDRYARKSDKIKVEVIDPVKNPAFVKKYDKEGNGVPQGSIIFESGEKFKVVNPYDLFNYDYQMQSVDSIAAEQRFTSAIMFVTSEKVPAVYFTQGHGETDLPGAKEILERENFKSGNVNLFTEEIPEDAELIIISSPKRDFDASEIEKLDKYFDKGGRAAFLFDVAKDELPKLEAYMKEWGIALRKDLVIESNKKNYSQNPTYLIPDMQSHDITGRLKSNELMMLVPVARSLEVLFTEQNGIKVTPLLKSSGQSWGKVNLESKTAQKQPEDTAGPLDIAVAIERANYGDNKKLKDTKILVMGNAAFLDSQMLSIPGIANVDFFMNSVNWAQDKEENITIRPKSLESERMAISQVQVLLNAALVILVIPFAVFILGGVVWMRRRHL